MISCPPQSIHSSRGFLLLPAQKISDDGSSFPTGLDHYIWRATIRGDSKCDAGCTILEAGSSNASELVNMAPER